MFLWRKTVLEKDYEEKFKKFVTARRGTAYKFTSPGRTGVPDRLVVLPAGAIGFVEMKKSKRDKPSEAQERQLNKLTQAGQKCYVLHGGGTDFNLRAAQIIEDIEEGTYPDRRWKITDDL